MSRSIYFATAKFDEHIGGPPWAVLRIDVSKPRGAGVTATVESLHWSRYVADQICTRLNSDPNAYCPEPPA